MFIIIFIFYACKILCQDYDTIREVYKTKYERESLDIYSYCLKSIKSVKENEDIDIMLYDGIINSKIKKIYERKKSKK
jgi:hypothetical protein